MKLSLKRSNKSAWMKASSAMGVYCMMDIIVVAPAFHASQRAAKS
ncbi:MAG: hypothetical protein ABIP97_02175 [Chthoniobacterales bacterium]